VLGLLVTSAEREQRLSDALAWARARVEIDPLSEPAHVDVIRLLAKAGDRTAALGAHRDLVGVLDRELGVAPLPTTLALREQIRAGAIQPARVAESVTQLAPVAVSQEAAAVAALMSGVADRFGALGDVARQLVEAGAMLGAPADLELLRAMAGRSESEVDDALDEALTSGLLIASGDSLSVAHPLVGLAARDGLSVARRRLLHGRAADLLARRHAPDGSGSARSVAEHLALAGRDLEAGEWFRVAAAAASDQEEAADALRATIALGRDTAAVREALGGVLVRLGQYDEALVAYHDAAAIVAQSSASPDVEARLEQAIAVVHDRLGETVLAQAGFERAAALAAGATKARALAALALVQHRRNLPEARATAREALTLAGNDAGARARAHHTLGILALTRDDLATAAEDLDAAVRLARTAADTDALIAALTGVSRLAMLRGDNAYALDTAQEGLSLAEGVGDVHRLGALHSHLADLLHGEGRDQEAMASQRASAAALAQVTGASERPEVWTLAAW